ncbi:hypothetical protein M9H77_27286 [Catharanthus roseus]|uniref:Uncharacterized protein n=1 Tax=Catharanthus roseus TaxID=4058 RepID=A0ACC0AGC2_CATRO|nr:hypothetical protein M9H77_27286 [Catharanthus roseus]
MPELVSDDLVMGSELCPLSPTVALHVLLNSGTRRNTTLIDRCTRRARLWVGPVRLHHYRRTNGTEIEFVASIEEDLSKPESDSEMVPEPEGVASADAEGMQTFVVGGFPIAASPTPVLPAESVSSFPALLSLFRGGVREHDICSCCLWCKQRIEAVGQ